MLVKATTILHYNIQECSELQLKDAHLSISGTRILIEKVILTLCLIWNLFDDRQRGSTPEIEFQRATTRLDTGNRRWTIENKARRRKLKFDDRQQGLTSETKV